MRTRMIRYFIRSVAVFGNQRLYDSVTAARTHSATTNMSEENTDAHAARSLSVGASTDIGRRPTQQDDYLVVASLFPDSDIEPCACFGVFDGHGGPEAPLKPLLVSLTPDAQVTTARRPQCLSKTPFRIGCSGDGMRFTPTAKERW